MNITRWDVWGEPCANMVTTSSKWLESERQHTLANRCSLFSAVSSALCCHSRSLLLRSLSCRTESAQVLGALSMVDTTAGTDCKELSAKKSLCRSRLERWHGNYHKGIVLFLRTAALSRWIRRRKMPHPNHSYPVARCVRYSWLQHQPRRAKLLALVFIHCRQLFTTRKGEETK